MYVIMKSWKNILGDILACLQLSKNKRLILGAGIIRGEAPNPLTRKGVSTRKKESESLGRSITANQYFCASREGPSPNIFTVRLYKIRREGVGCRFRRQTGDLEDWDETIRNFVEMSLNTTQILEERLIKYNNLSKI